MGGGKQTSKHNIKNKNSEKQKSNTSGWKPNRNKQENPGKPKRNNTKSETSETSEKFAIVAKLCLAVFGLIFTFWAFPDFQTFLPLVQKHVWPFV